MGLHGHSSTVSDLILFCFRHLPGRPHHHFLPTVSSNEDRPWTHDGFEELKRREEQRSQRRGHSQGSNGNPRPPRGNFTPRGRPFARGGFSPRPASVPSTDSPSMSSRTWFLIKPERPWTKHHELFLYSDPSQRPRSGQGPTYRVKLSGTSPEAIVQSSTQHPPPRVPTPPCDAAHDDGELVFVWKPAPRVTRFTRTFLRSSK
jgi:hypothetical protein